MVTTIFLFAAFLLCCTPSLAVEITSLETETTQELLLFYDWDDLMVEAPTRRPTRIKDVAENISIVTAEEIAAMNAHSVNEILQTVTGVGVEFHGNHFGGNGSLSIHASSYEHVLILLDGVRLNDVDAGWPETAGIPVQIIDRIEIVKGPASSTWGSALGGVINIITKQAGTNRRPTGTLYTSYGSGSSRDYRADIAGKTGKLGYYLYGGYMNTDGLVDDKYFKNKSLYAKINSALTDDVSLKVTAAYWHPDVNGFKLPASDLNYFNDVKNYLVTGQLDASLSPAVKLNLDLYIRIQDWHNQNEMISTGSFIEEQLWDNDSNGGSVHLTWEKNNHTMLFGSELSRGENDRTWRYASASTIDWGTETRKEWALYFNDTIKWEKLTLTPGLRYDHLSIVNANSYDLVSPSLGATYSITEDTLFRATTARGFIRPGIGLVVGGAGYAGFPDLKPENLWSFQAGIESTHFRKTHLKADIFYHRQDDTWYWNDDVGLYINGGLSERKGMELKGTASPFENFTASLGFFYIWVEPYQEQGDETYGLNIKLNYNTPSFGSLTLFGHYYWWNEHEVTASASYGDMIWDFHYNKVIYTHKDSGTTVNVFFNGRNLFNGEHYWIDYLKNPDRWFEAGLRFNL